MKRLLLFLLTGALAFALVGCGKTEPPAQPATEEPKVEAPVTPAPEPEPAQTPKPSTTTSAGFDAATALGLDSTSKDNPAGLNQWVATMKHNGESDKDELVYVRITGLMRDQVEVQAAIDAYNAEDRLRDIEPLEDEDLEYFILDYEVYFPDDYPADPELGFSNPSVVFALQNYEGGGFDNGKGGAYIGLGIPVQDISPRIEYPNKLIPGDLWADGRYLFVMVKGTTDFLIQTYYSTDAGQQNIWFKE